MLNLATLARGQREKASVDWETSDNGLISRQAGRAAPTLCHAEEGARLPPLPLSPVSGPTPCQVRLAGDALVAPEVDLLSGRRKGAKGIEGLGFPGGSDGGKESVCNVGDPGLISGSGRVRKIPRRRAYSNILAWRIPCTEEPGGLQSTEPQELVTTEQLTLSLSPHEGPVWTLPRAEGSAEGNGPAVLRWGPQTRPPESLERWMQGLRQEGR